MWGGNPLLFRVSPLKMIISHQCAPLIPRKQKHLYPLNPRWLSACSPPQKETPTSLLHPKPSPEEGASSGSAPRARSPYLRRAAAELAALCRELRLGWLLSAGAAGSAMQPLELPFLVGGG